MLMCVWCVTSVMCVFLFSGRWTHLVSCRPLVRHPMQKRTEECLPQLRNNQLLPAGYAMYSGWTQLNIQLMGICSSGFNSLNLSLWQGWTQNSKMKPLPLKAIEAPNTVRIICTFIAFIWSFTFTCLMYCKIANTVEPKYQKCEPHKMRRFFVTYRGRCSHSQESTHRGSLPSRGPQTSTFWKRNSNWCNFEGRFPFVRTGQPDNCRTCQFT